MQYSLFIIFPSKYFSGIWMKTCFDFQFDCGWIFALKTAKNGGRWKLFFFPFLAKSKKLLIWAGKHLTTTVNFGEQEAIRNVKKAWWLLAFLNTGEHVWQLFNSTPKRGVGGSNPLMDASEQRRKPLFSRVFGFSHMKRHEKALSLYEIKFYSKIWFLTSTPESNGCYKTKSPANF